MTHTTLPDCTCDYYATRRLGTVHRMRRTDCPRHGAADTAALDQSHAIYDAAMEKRWGK